MGDQPLPRSIEERVGRLERRLRISTVIGILLGIALFNAMFLSDRSRVEAESFVVTDREGKMVAEFSADLLDEGGLLITGREGNRIEIGGFGIHMFGPDQACADGTTCSGPSLSLSPNGLSMQSLGGGGSSGAITMNVFEGAPSLLLSDAETGVVAAFPPLDGSPSTATVAPAAG